MSLTMRYENLYTIVTYLIAAVWLVNGLFCKVLHLTPRHERIVARILGEGISGLFLRWPLFKHRGFDQKAFQKC